MRFAMAVKVKEVSEREEIIEHHAPWDCEDWECAEHKNTASHSLWPPGSSDKDMAEARRSLARHLEKLEWNLFVAMGASDMGTYYSPSLREHMASRRLYRVLQEMLKKPLNLAS